MTNKVSDCLMVPSYQRDLWFSFFLCWLEFFPENEAILHRQDTQRIHHLFLCYFRTPYWTQVPQLLPLTSHGRIQNVTFLLPSGKWQRIGPKCLCPTAPPTVTLDAKLWQMPTGGLDPTRAEPTQHAFPETRSEERVWIKKWPFTWAINNKEQWISTNSAKWDTSFLFLLVPIGLKNLGNTESSTMFSLGTNSDPKKNTIKQNSWVSLFSQIWTIHGGGGPFSCQSWRGPDNIFVILF